MLIKVEKEKRIYVKIIVCFFLFLYYEMSSDTDESFFKRLFIKKLHTSDVYQCERNMEDISFAVRNYNAIHSEKMEALDIGLLKEKKLLPRNIPFDTLYHCEYRFIPDYSKDKEIIVECNVHHDYESLQNLINFKDPAHLEEYARCRRKRIIALFVIIAVTCIV